MDPQPSDFHIRDIAHALSNLCRFNGQCKRFYSVAEHSLLCSYLVPQEYALEALLHDATEAYCGDMVFPLKAMLPAFVEVEQRIDAAIRTRFGLPAVMTPEVHLADRRMVHLEFLELMNYKVEDLAVMEPVDPKICNVVIMCAGPAAIAPVFYQRFLELGGHAYGTC